MDWQPIETAPTDGRDVLVGRWSGGRWIVACVHWTPLRDGMNRLRFDKDGKPVGNWKVVCGGGRDIWQPLCWLPLPEPTGNFQ